MSKEIVKPEQQVRLAKKEELPEHLRGLNNNEGLEELSREDLTLPRVAVAQTLSYALKKSKPQFIPGLEEGMLYNTLTREIYGMSLLFVPIIFSKMRIKFEDINKGGGILCSSPNAIDGGQLCPSGCQQCEFSRFRDNEAPECNLFMNYPSLLPDKGGELAVISMKSTSLSTAKQLNGLMRLANLPAYAKVYKLSVVPDSRNGNDFFNFNVSPVGFAPPEIASFGKQLYDQLKVSGVKMDTSDLQEETEFNPSEM